MSLQIDENFICKWAEDYDKKYQKANATEQCLLDYARGLPSPKVFERQKLIKLCDWKTGNRVQRHYGQGPHNDQLWICRVMTLAQQVPDKRKLKVLTLLDGVRTPTASTILYFLFPHTFPIFDKYAPKTLKAANLWQRKENDKSEEAWWDYVQIVRGLSICLDLPLRTVEKALFQSRGRP